MAEAAPARAEEIEVLRGEETETEVYLEGSEEAYSMLGELECTGAFLRLKETTEENSRDYQALETDGEGGPARLLVSNRGENGSGLWLRVRVEGVRIGTGAISTGNLQLADENGAWLEQAGLPEITVKVLPNPLVVSLSGTMGNNGWHTEYVSASVSDKDAAELWYDLGGGRTAYTGPFEITDGTTVLTVTSDDGYGYKKEEVRWLKVDTVAPSLEVSLRELGWQQEAIQVAAEASDATSGLARAAWAFSGSSDSCGSRSALNGEEELSTDLDGSWYLHLKAVDMAGNETEAVYGPYRKDSVKPEISFANLQDGQLVEEGIVPEILATDSCSGIKEISCLLDGQAWNPAEITGRGTHTLTVTAEDLAGNTRTETVEFAIYDRIQVTAEAEDTHYTGMGRFSARVTYRGEPLPEAEVEFFLNGESLGVRRTDNEGRVWLQLPVELSPQEAQLTVKVSRDDARFLLGGEATDAFLVKPEQAWLLYGGDYSVWNGKPLRIYLETGEVPDHRMGDITRAELLVALYKVEKDGSRTFVEEAYLTPDERGVVTHEFAPATGLYELKASFTENSCYTGQETVLHPAVFDIDAELGRTGGSLLLDLPHLGLYMKLDFTFLPPSLEAEVEAVIPGTGITLAENRITGYSLSADGLSLCGSAVDPADGTVYSYEVRSGYTLGIFLNELETSLWKGGDKTQEPMYHFEWSAEESTGE